MSEVSTLFPERIDQFIWSLRERVLRDFMEIHDNPPSMLFHYTKNEGLIGILGGQYPNIRATHAAFLNDPRELIYAEEALIEFCDRRIAAYQGQEDVRRMLYTALKARLPRMRQERDVYVFSLSERMMI